jgi:hypothetical protein
MLSCLGALVQGSLSQSSIRGAGHRVTARSAKAE